MFKIQTYENTELSSKNIKEMMQEQKNEYNELNAGRKDFEHEHDCENTLLDCEQLLLRQKAAEYTNYLINSKTEAMKRKMVGLIDSIHEEERSDLINHLDFIKPEMIQWQKKCVEPVNFEVAVINKERTQSARRKRQQLWEEATAPRVDTRTESTKRLEGLRELCSAFGMPDLVEDKKKPNRIDLIKYFTEGTQYAYTEMKRHQNLDQTFLSCRYKQREKSPAQERYEEIVAEQEEIRRKAKESAEEPVETNPNNFWTRKSMLKKHKSPRPIH